MFHLERTIQPGQGVSVSLHHSAKMTKSACGSRSSTFIPAERCVSLGGDGGRTGTHSIAQNQYQQFNVS